MHLSRERKTSNYYLPVLLLAILVDEVCNNSIIGMFSEKSIIKLSSGEQVFFYAFFLLLQMIAAPLQGGFSDFYCRKKSIIWALIFSVMSLVFSFLYIEKMFFPVLMLYLTVIVKTCFGNTRPLAWAGIADINNRNYRLSLGLSTSAIAIGYLTLLGIDDFFEKKQSVFVIFLLYACVIPIVCKFLFDLLDRKKVRDEAFAEARIKSPKQNIRVKHFFTLIALEFKNVKNRFLKCRRFRLGLFGVFLPVEVSFYSTHSLGVDFLIEKFEIITISMILGYLVGVLMLKFYEKEEDSVVMQKGYTISISSFIPIFLSAIMLPSNDLRWVVAFCYFIYSFGVAFIVPSLFSILSKERESHDQGKIYGLIDSTDSFALLIALIVGVIYNLFDKILFMSVFSFIILLFSRFYYGKFKRTPKIKLF